MTHPLEHKIPPPLVALLVCGAMWLGARFTPALHLLPAWRFALVAACALFALGFTAPAMRAFRRAHTTINPVDLGAASALVTSGVYRWSRNPMYVGLTSLLLAWAVWLSAPAVLLGPIVFVLFITRFQIIPEERMMSAKFGNAYTEYQKSVRRWL